MKNWKIYKLGDLVDINKYSITKNYSYDEIEYIDTSAVTEGRFSAPQTMKLLDAPSRAKRIVKNHDIVYSTVRPSQKHYGLIRNVKPNTVTSTGFAVLTSKNIDPNFLYYYLTQTEILSFLNGVAEANTTTFPAFNPSLFETIEIKAPNSIKEQSQIASILSSLDNKIELNLQMNQTLEAMAQVIFKEWFVDFKFPGSTKKLVNGLPKGWSTEVFKNQFDVERGLSYKGSGLTESGEGVPMHNLNSVYEGGGYKNEGIKYYSGEYKERHIVGPREIIVANTEQGHKHLLIGFPAVTPHYFGEEAIFSHHIYRVRPKSTSYLTPQFVYYLLLQPDVRDQVIGCTNGTTVNMLKIDGLQLPQFNLPSKDIVVKFSQLIETIWQRKETNYLENQSLIQVRDSLLPKLMTGKIQVKS